MNQNGSLSTIGDSCVNCCLKFLQAEFKNGIRRKLSPENFSLLAKLYEIDVPSIQRTIDSSKLEDLFVCRQCFNKLNSLCKAKEKLLNLEKDLKRICFRGEPVKFFRTTILMKLHLPHHHYITIS